MHNNLLDGRKISAQINQQTTQQTTQHKTTHRTTPTLTIIQIGNHPPSQTYIQKKQQTAQQIGIHTHHQHLPHHTTQTQLLQHIHNHNQNPNTHAILIQAPLPKHIQPNPIYTAIQPHKDVDGFHPTNLGKLLIGDPTGFTPCTPAGIHQLLRHTQIPLPGAHAVILSRSNIVGKPMAALLIQKKPDANCTVTICHTQTPNLTQITQTADILIVAIGRPNYITPNMIKQNATIIDVGTNHTPHPNNKNRTRLTGDVHFQQTQPKARYITPNPGGVGPMTIAMLMRNTLKAAQQQTPKNQPTNQPTNNQPTTPNPQPKNQHKKTP